MQQEATEGLFSRRKRAEIRPGSDFGVLGHAGVRGIAAYPAKLEDLGGDPGECRASNPQVFARRCRGLSCIESSQERLSPLSEVDPDILAQLRPLVREAIKSGQPVHVGANWWCRATVEQERLEADLLPWAEGAPLVSMTVTPGEGNAPALLEVAVAGLLQAAAHGRVTESQADMAGELARCLAWAWLERPR